MSVFDLKPLTAKTIDELKLKPDQLWEIKIDENIYGPFETLQLKHYSKENRSVMLRAHVSNMSVDDWRPFFEVREFLNESKYHGPYWTLSHGQKSSPLSKEEIAKRIELGTITRHDEISEDEGKHWHRIANHPEFEAHFTTGTSLPQTPQESSFQQAKLQVLKKLEQKNLHSDEKESIASIAHASLSTKEKTKTVNIENIKLPPERSENAASFWQQHRSQLLWVSPVFLIAVYFGFFHGSLPVSDVAEVKESNSEEFKGRSGPRRSKRNPWSRSPASADGSSYNRSSVTQTPYNDDNYPTTIETHMDDGQNYPDPSAEADQVAEIQDQENKADEPQANEPVRDPAQEGESLDATMNNEAQEQPNPAVDQPVVEEVSDF